MEPSKTTKSAFVTRFTLEIPFDQQNSTKQKQQQQRRQKKFTPDFCKEQNYEEEEKRNPSQEILKWA